jgi:hypothetical protein
MMNLLVDENTFFKHGPLANAYLDLRAVFNNEPWGYLEGSRVSFYVGPVLKICHV